ncbi:MAG TPA: DsrE family protein [Burkholderiaceae bacterium]|nr:DsrE family protein [Burkholderiaceae bacterium]
MSFEVASRKGLAILLWAAEPKSPHLLATPFWHAAAAAAMDLEVEVYFTARSVHLLIPGVAEQLMVDVTGMHSAWSSMKNALNQGARFLACQQALNAQGLTDSRLRPECSGHGGSVQFMARAVDPLWATLVY